ncbi:ABC transporter ATP-binding protein [Oligoflexus tunisiensis]|uniref:ABC transporter ATP-binding protein n=1 Tax=Oligoflexus tunisiensis TaxID=708132 RepID=UPI000B1DC816|nr:ATP-binding cassette domain-containing protein [Oligoflexus tunisiensis]
MVTETGTPLLSIRGLETRFGSKTIHSGLDLDVQRGEILVLFGGSGSGKSTLLRAIIGLDAPSAGAIFLEGQDITQFDEKQWREVRKKVGYAFQNGALFDSLTVAENLEYPLRELTDMSAEERYKARQNMLERIGMPEIGDLYPAELSGGMQKRVGMARALMLNPALILYDEPTAGLDPANIKKIANLMLDRKAEGQTGILVTHDVACALMVGDRIAFLNEGRIAVIQERAAIDREPDERIAAYIKGDVE